MFPLVRIEPGTSVIQVRHPLPAQCMLGYGQQAGGTHPTAMQSCSKRASITLHIFYCNVTNYSHSLFYTETIDIVSTKINYWRVDDDTFDTV